jgi:hypothetical protein
VKLYLGTHMPSWLEKTDVPLFVSRTRLFARKTFPRALGPWALDSGGFTVLNTPPHYWRLSPRAYVEEVRIYQREIGNLAWAAPQDWMCEPWIVAKTGLTVPRHQWKTAENFLELREIAPELPFVPVLQGWKRDDYRRHVDLYAKLGVDLTKERPVGLGSVCRRQHTPEIDLIVSTLATEYGLALHGFGVKTSGLAAYGSHLDSSDTLAWSYRGRRVYPPTCGSTTHVNEANCFAFAMAWRQRLLSVKERPAQLAFEGMV